MIRTPLEAAVLDLETFKRSEVIGEICCGEPLEYARLMRW